MIAGKHAKQRIKERIGIPKGSSERIAQKALEKGLTHSDTTGHLRKYLDKLYLSHKTANNMRVYNQKIFIFKNNILITVLPLPNNLKKIADKDNERKKNK